MNLVGSGDGVVRVIENELEEHHAVLLADVRASHQRLSEVLERLERDGVLAYKDPSLQTTGMGLHIDLDLARAVALSKSLEGMKAWAKRRGSAGA